MSCLDVRDWPSETRENVECAFRTALAIFLALYFLEVGVNSDPPSGNLPVGFLAVVLIAKMRSDNLGYTLLLGVMLSFVAAVTIPLGYGLIVFLRGLDEQSRTKYNVALPITMFVVGFVFSAFPLPKLPGGATFPTPFRTLGVVLIWLSCYKARRGQDPMFAPKMVATCVHRNQRVHAIDATSVSHAGRDVLLRRRPRDRCPAPAAALAEPRRLAVPREGG